MRVADLLCPSLPRSSTGDSRIISEEGGQGGLKRSSSFLTRPQSLPEPNGAKRCIILRPIRWEVNIAAARNWAIKQVAQVDIRRPGFAGHFLRASHERRQVISLYLACRGCDDLDVDRVDQLIGGSHDAILNLAVEDVPQGLRGALRRAARKYHPQEFYVELIDVLRTEDVKERRAFSHLAEIDLDLLKRWRLAPPELRCGHFISLFEDVDALAACLKAVETLVEAGISKADAINRLSQVKTKKALSTAFDKLLQKLKFRGFPLAGNPFITPVRTVGELRCIAKFFRNCSASFVFDGLEGRSLFYVLQGEQPVGLVHLEKERGEWIVSDIVGRSNRPLPPSIMMGALEYFEGGGIQHAANFRSSKWDAVRRFCRQSM